MVKYDNRAGSWDESQPATLRERISSYIVVALALGSALYLTYKGHKMNKKEQPKVETNAPSDERKGLEDRVEK